MKVKSLLAKAAKCKTQNDANNLLEALDRAFGNADPLKHLSHHKAEACMVDGKPFVAFVLNLLISEHYIIMIEPRISDGKMVIEIGTNHMLDGAGLSSESWEVVEGMEDLIEADGDQTIADLAQRCKELAIIHHTQLVERVGIPHSAAVDAANKSW